MRSGSTTPLLKPDWGEYDYTHSELLRSPSLADLRVALRNALFEAGQIDTFTLFFAGHGGVKAGGYYLCLTDSRPEMLSATGFGKTELFSAINEAQPRQSNIIIDACQAGGLVADLHAVIKPELIGGFDTPGISIFAFSAADQYSCESSAGGLGTINLMQCIEGAVVVQTTRPSLDLLEVGRVASSLLVDQHVGQVPVLWGLNLYGEARFCKNIHYQAMWQPHPPFPTILPGSPPHAPIKGHANQIWKEYFAIGNDFEVGRLLEMIGSSNR